MSDNTAPEPIHYENRPDLASHTDLVFAMEPADEPDPNQFMIAYSDDSDVDVALSRETHDGPGEEIPDEDPEDDA